MESCQHEHFNVATVIIVRNYTTIITAIKAVATIIELACMTTVQNMINDDIYDTMIDGIILYKHT